MIREQYSSYLSDESKLSGDVPLSISFPTNVQQLSWIMREHSERGECTTISGTRSGVVGASVPTGETHLVSLEKLDGIEGLETDEQGRPFVRAYAGTKVSAIQAWLQEHHPHLYYPVDPTYQHAAVAGNIGTNASGMRTFFYGSTRDWVRTLEIVLVDGTQIRLTRGTCAAKNGELILSGPDGEKRLLASPIRVPKTKHAIGYHYSNEVDPVDIFVGSEGTLGVTSRVEIWVTPKPQHRLYYTQFFDADEKAFAFADAVRAAPLDVLALEFFDRESLSITTKHPQRENCRTIRAIKPEHQCGIFADILLKDEASIEQVDEQIRIILKSVGGDPHDSLAGHEDRDLIDFKVFRHAIPESINSVIAARKKTIPRIYKISTDMSVDPSHLRRLYAFYRKKLSGMEHYIFGHIGNAHLHLNVVPRTEAELDAFFEIYPEFAEEVVACGGAVAGEHGIGRVKKHFLKYQYTADELDTLKKIKSFFDPQWLLNRGVLIDR